MGHGAPEAAVPMEVDPTAGISLHGDLELASRPSYAQVAAGVQAIGPLPLVPIHERPGSEGALGDQALSSGRHLERSTECAEAISFVQPKPKPIRLVRSGLTLSPVKVLSPLKGELPPSVLQALSELEDCYSFGPSPGAQVLTPVTETMVSGALGLDETPMDLDMPLGTAGQDLTLAGAPGGCFLSLCPDSGTEDSDVEDGASRRCFSCSLSERMSASGPLLARVQKHQMPAKTCSPEVGAVEADGPSATRTEEEGAAFKQNVAVMRDALREDVAPPSLQVTPRVEPLSALPRAELTLVEVSFRSMFPKG